MTSSNDVVSQAATLLEELAQRLDPQYLAVVVDRPIDRLLDRGGDQPLRCATVESLMERLLDFVQGAYRTAVPWARRLPTSQALDVALELLATGYDGGCDGVWADLACYGVSVAQPVLESVAAALKCKLRDEYQRWLVERYQRAVDWPTRCAMAELVLACYGRYLADPVRAMSPGQLAGCLFEQFAAAVAALGPPRLVTDDRVGSAAASCADVL